MSLDYNNIFNFLTGFTFFWFDRFHIFAFWLVSHYVFFLLFLHFCVLTVYTFLHFEPIFPLDHIHILVLTVFTFLHLTVWSFCVFTFFLVLTVFYFFTFFRFDRFTFLCLTVCTFLRSECFHIFPFWLLSNFSILTV